MYKKINRRCQGAIGVTIVAVTSALAGIASRAHSITITADFEGNSVGHFASQYEEAGMIFTSDGGAGLSFLDNTLTGDIGLFEATGGGPIGVNAMMPSFAESVTVRFFLAQDDVVTLAAYDDRGFLLDSAIANGPASPHDYLVLTVEAGAPAISRIYWIGSSDTILVAGEVTANIVPAPGAITVFALACVAWRRRRNDS